MARSTQIRRKLARGVACAALNATVVITGSVAPVVAEPTDTSNVIEEASFVTASGAEFYRDSKPFRFVAANVYDALGAVSSWACNETDRMTPEELSEMLKFLRSNGVSVIRFWAYQTYMNRGDDFSGMHRLIDVAKQRDVLLLPVLEDGPGHCTSHTRPKHKISNWYTSGYKRPLGSVKLSYRDYAAAFAREFADEPQIMAIQLFNEAGTNKRIDEHSVLFPFARDMLRVVKAVNHNHLITFGTQSNDAPGGSGADFQEIYEMFDFASAHDWSAWGHGDINDPLPGSIDNGAALPDPRSEHCQKLDALIACSVAIARDILNKPIVIDESGIRAVTEEDRLQRAEMMTTRMEVAFRQGVNGYGLWHITDGVTDSQNFNISPAANDPIFEVTSQIGNWIDEGRFDTE